MIDWNSFFLHFLLITIGITVLGIFSWAIYTAPLLGAFILIVAALSLPFSIKKREAIDE